MSNAARIDADSAVAPAAGIPVGPAVLRAEGLSKQYGTVTVLSDVTLDILPGEIHAIIGENGAGKSTFMRLLSGYIEPTDRTFSMAGHQVRFTRPDKPRPPALRWCIRRSCWPMR